MQMLWMSIVPPSQFLLGECSYEIPFSFVFSLVSNVISAGKLIGRIDIFTQHNGFGKEVRSAELAERVSAFPHRLSEK